jgi:DMSO/TMAO reductase YedYZ molybdopterin-dependent catalytic subunit
MEWDLKITSLSGTTVNLTYGDLLALPKSTVNAELSCYGVPLTNGNWSGVKLSDLLNQVGGDPTVGSIDFLAQDEYNVSIPIGMAMRSDVIVAYEMDGAALSEGLRLVVPGANGNIWISFITSISMSTSKVTEAQSGSSGEPSIGTTQSSTNTTGQVSNQQQTTQGQPQPATPKNVTTITPVAPPENVTQPYQQQEFSRGLGFPVAIGYGIALGVTVGLVIAGVVVYRRKNTRILR